MGQLNTNVVFVHSSFRTGSTFVRSCFRRDPRALSFQEVFNENLADMTPETISHFNTSGWHSKHPSMAPYFLEFQSLLSRDRKGVELFDRSMSYGTFFSGAVLETKESKYVASLINLAHKHERVPVITCTRSLGRLRAMKHEFGGLHLMIYRNIFDQWCSYTDQWLRGDDGFIETVWLALKGEHHDEIARKIAGVYHTETRSPTDPNNFFAFCLLHLYLYARAVDHASDVMDIDRLAADKNERDRLERLISDRSGLSVDFSSAKQTKSFSLVDIGGVEILRETLNSFPEIFAIPQTTEGSSFLKKAAEELVVSFDEFTKMSGSLAREFTRQSHRLSSLESDLKIEREEVESLRAHLAMKRDESAVLQEELESLRRMRETTLSKVLALIRSLAVR